MSFAEKRRLVEQRRMLEALEAELRKSRAEVEAEAKQSHVYVAQAELSRLAPHQKRIRMLQLEKQLVEQTEFHRFRAWLAGIALSLPLGFVPVIIFDLGVFGYLVFCAVFALGFSSLVIYGVKCDEAKYAILTEELEKSK